MVDAVHDFGHVLYEISNESPAGSLGWQAHMVDVVRRAERRRGLRREDRHPVGITALYSGGRNRDLLRGPADWVSLHRRGGYKYAPPAADGSKVSLLDTDHLWGVGGDERWVWKSFLRGHHPVYMDPLDDDPERRRARRAMGQAVELSRRVDLATTIPEPRRATSGYCLAGPEALVAFLPRWRRGRLGVDLSGLGGEFETEWLDPAAGEAVAGTEIAGGGRRKMRSPWRGDAVLALRKAGSRPLFTER